MKKNKLLLRIATWIRDTTLALYLCEAQNQAKIIYGDEY